MLALRASKVAKEAMEKGRNCCEAILLSAGAVWDLPSLDDTLAAAMFFARGMGSGCICGALVGMVMVSGLLQKKYRHPLGAELPVHLHERFKQEFGSTCCRVIRQSRPLWQRAGNKGCIQLTSKAAAMLVEEWEGAVHETSDNLRDHTDI